MFQKILALSMVAAVSAHQNFHQFWVNDVTPGYQVGIRMPPSNSPVVSRSVRLFQHVIDTTTTDRRHQR